MLIGGILHLHGTFYSDDLHPANMDLLNSLQTSSIKMDKTGNLWQLWIGFNAMFSVGLLFIGAINLFLTIKYFAFQKHQHFISLLTLLSTGYFAWIGFNYIIQAFFYHMLVCFCLYMIGYLLLLKKSFKTN